MQKNINFACDYFPLILLVAWASDELMMKEIKELAQNTKSS